METGIIPLFILSLPRSGSTLCQRILAAHENIVTVSESHLLLPLLYTLREEGVYSEYDHRYTVKGIRAFCLELPNGLEDYLAELRTLILRLYARAATGDVKYFLDKAGAYHLIVKEIMRLFPEAKYIFLWRNPLAVVASLMESWRDGKWNLYEHEIYLFEGLSQLVTAFQAHADRVCPLKYEDLILNPGKEWARVFAYLEMPFDATLLSRFSETRLRGDLGDQPGMKRYQQLSQEPLGKWKRTLANPVRKFWCRKYLHYVGKERLAVMGYDLDTLLADLNALPFSARFLGSDLARIPYGIAYRLAEGQIVKEKLHALRAGRRVYLHH